MRTFLLLCTLIILSESHTFHPEAQGKMNGVESSFMKTTLLTLGALALGSVMLLVLRREKYTNMNKLFDVIGSIKLKCCCATFLVLVILIPILIFVALTNSINFCRYEDCESVSISDIGLSETLAYFAVKAQFSNVPAPGSSAIKAPWHQGTKIKFPIEQTESTIYASPQDEDDHDSNSESIAERYITLIIFKILRSIGVIKDNHKLMTEKQSNAWEKMVTGNGGKPLIPGWSYNLTTDDDTISQFGFAGLAAHHLKLTSNETKKRVKLLGLKGEAEFEVDFSRLEAIEVREGYARNGGTAYYDASANVLGIKYLGTIYSPGHEKWEWVKWNFRCSAFLMVTGLDHLVGAHMLVSGRTALASEENLNKIHPLRIFLKPFTHHSQWVNWNSIAALFPKHGLLHRATAFTDAGFDDFIAISASWIQRHAFIHSVEDFKNYEELVSKVKDYSWGQDITAYVENVEKYVMKFMDTYYPTDASIRDDPAIWNFWYQSNMRMFDTFHPLNRANLNTHLVYYITIVTAYHQQVGYLRQILKDSNIATWKVRPDQIGSELQAAMQVMTIAIATGPPQVMLMEFNPLNIIPSSDPHAETMLHAWRDFQSDMEVLDVAIKEKNKIRRWPCESNLPSRQGISIGV